MNNSIRNIQLVAVVVVLISTIIAFFLEMKEMYENRDITLADLLLMFIYIEVIELDLIGKQEQLELLIL